MRLSYPRQSGDLVIFRDDFTSLRYVIDNGGGIVGTPVIDRGVSGGQVRYYGPALAIAHTGSVSILCHAIVAVSGSNQALWSIGSGATRRMEVGIDATGRPYVWGTAQVLVGQAITDGDHDIAWTISSTGRVVCYVDAEAWGSGTVAFGAVTTNWRMVVGGSVLGTLPWAGTAKPIQIYRGVLDHASVASETGVSDYFTPPDVAGCLAWYQGVDDGVKLTRATAPNNTNSDFRTWSGAYPDETPVGWSKHPSPGTAGNHLAPYGGNACELVSDGTFTDCYKTGTQGNRYALDVDVFLNVGNGIRSINDEAATITGLGHFSQELTLAAASLGLKRLSGATQAAFSNLIFRNLSRTQFNPSYCVGSWPLPQAVAARMPWYSNGLVLTEATGFGSTAAAVKAGVKCLHDGTGGTFVVAFTPSTNAASRWLFDTGNLGSIQPGAQLYRNNANVVQLAVKNGAASIGYLIAGIAALNNRYVVISRNGATSMNARFNGSPVAPVAYTGAVSANDAIQLAFGDPGGSAGGDNSTLHQCAIYQGEISDADAAKLERYMGAL